MLRRIQYLFLAVVLAACGDGITDPGNHNPPPDTSSPPAIQREMRGLWIATVANIDWPSSKTLTADQQRAELIDILDRAVAAGLNTIVFHVRPAADAVYQSSLEPWGIMLTGTQGKDPGYDPLAFAIQEAHARGLELHAWINPFRAANTADSLKLAANHVFNTQRSMVRVYGSNLWLDPGDPAAQDRSMSVIRDIVTRYDVDGLHADDYFYPYVENNLVFPDSATYAQYGGGLSLADWRRANIDRFVQRMYQEVHAIKPFVKVGISPFGIWRPGNPPGVQGLDAYNSIYADSRKWLQQGWVDYFAPQLYWSIAAPQQSYTALLDWWLAQNTMHRNVWPGLAAYRVQDGTSSQFSIDEIPNQITATRSRNGGGNLLYNTTSTLKRNGGALATRLASNLYETPALVPASPWLDATPPAAPTLTAASSTSIKITPAAGEPVRWWTVRTHNATGWTTRIMFGTNTTIVIDSGVDRVLVEAVDQAGNMSSTAEWAKLTA